MPGNDEPKVAMATVAGVVREGLGIAGACLIGVGGWLHYPPLGMMLGGATIVSLVVLSMIVGRR